MSTPPDVILVASDLHLGEGRDADTQVYSRCENCFAGDALGRWLAHHRTDAQRGALLVLNGDTFDFLRIVRAPVGPADYAAWQRRLSDRPERAAPENVSSDERHRFGLQTDDYKAVWKLHVIFTGHPEVFDALARWLEAGGRITLVKGNHDLELHWPAVLEALREELGKRVAEHGGDPACVERVEVKEDGFSEGNLYLEHGHRCEALTAVVGPPELPGTPGQLNLPLGSFINRYLINKLESLDPQLDNVRPVTQALVALMRRHPIAVWSAYFRAWRFVWRAIWVRKRWSSVLPVVAVFLGLIGPPALLTFVALSLVRPDLTAWASTGVRVGGSVAGALVSVLAPYVFGVIIELGRRLGLLGKGHRGVETAARERLRERFGEAPVFPVVYAVMGHTHVPAVRPLGSRAIYVNTGTWIDVWPLDRPDLAGRVVYSYSRFTRNPGPGGGYAHEALVWDDQAGEPRPARLVAS